MQQHTLYFFLINSLLATSLLSYDDSYFNFDEDILQLLSLKKVKKDLSQPTAKSDYIIFLNDIIADTRNFAGQNCNLFCEQYPGFAKVHKVIMGYFSWQLINRLGLYQEKLALMSLEQQIDHNLRLLDSEPEKVTEHNLELMLQDMDCHRVAARAFEKELQAKQERMSDDNFYDCMNKSIKEASIKILNVLQKFETSNSSHLKHD